MKRRIAVTGGIAMGKSTVLASIERYGLKVASADQIARDVFFQEATQRAISTISGLETPVDRAELRALMSRSDEIRRKINEITHPEILRNLLNTEADAFEVPLLFETCLWRFFDRVWVVWCPEDVQMARMKARDGTSNAYLSQISTQVPISAKLAMADVIVRTNRSISSVHDYVSRMLRQ